MKNSIGFECENGGCDYVLYLIRSDLDPYLGYLWREKVNKKSLVGESD